MAKCLTAKTFRLKSPTAIGLILKRLSEWLTLKSLNAAMSCQIFSNLDFIGIILIMMLHSEQFYGELLTSKSTAIVKRVTCISVFKKYLMFSWRHKLMLVRCKYFKISVRLLIVYKVIVQINFMPPWRNVSFQLSWHDTEASFFFNWFKNQREQDRQKFLKMI